METNKDNKVVSNENCYSVFYKDGDEANEGYLSKRDAFSLAMNIEDKGYGVIVAKNLGDHWETIYQTEANEKELPNSWEEFCETNPLKAGESWATGCSDILVVSDNGLNRRRNKNKDRILLPNKEYAQAILALCQLIQLRDCYRQGWKPDYSAGNAQKKFFIAFDRGMLDWLSSGYCASEHHIFAFQSDDIRRKFFKNFRDLLKKIQPLFV